MTREEALNKAINIVRYFEAHFAKSKEAREDMANIIEALEQEPCEDAVSRKEVLNQIFYSTDNTGDVVLGSALWERIVRMPSVTPQEPTTKNDLGVDVVNRKELLKIYEDRFLELQKLKHLKDNKGLEDRQLGVNYCINILKELPSVNPQKIGHWIPVSERLPEVGSEVLVCYDFKGNRSVYIANFYGDGEFHGYDDEYLTSEGRKYRKAVAWMPLPEPYKAESEVRNDKKKM